PVIREVSSHKLSWFSSSFPSGSEYRKDWEIAMAVRALDHFGALRPDATLLGVAVGTEDTLFYLTRRVRQLFATDRYYGAGDWGTVAPGLMLVEPQAVAPFDFDVNRLVVQHMDGRWLRYPDETFDGIFSSGSIEHFGGLEDAAYSAYEMGRVLKPGGVLSLSTEFRLSGPPDGIGWPGLTLLFSMENIRRFIVEASGLEPVDDLVTTVSASTLAAPRDLDQVVRDRLNAPPGSGPEFTLMEFPHLVLVKDDYVFGSVHLTLRKTERYSEGDNAWARPPKSVLESISAYNRSVVGAPRPAELSYPPEAEPAHPAESPPAEPEAPAAAMDYSALLDLAESQANMAVSGIGQVDSLLQAVDQSRDESDVRLAEIGRLRARLSERLAQPDLAPAAGEAAAVPTSAHEVTLPEGARFTAVLEATPPDAVSQLLTLPNGLDHHHTVRVMLDLLEPLGRGGRVVDLGAHVGTFALAAAAVGCDVLAVEASPLNAFLLRSSVWQNGFHGMHVVNAAVTDAPGEVQFLPDGPHGHVSWGGPGETLPVPAVTVDELVGELGWDRVSFVKMDIEGSETKALAGMRKLLGGPAAPPVLFESNGHTLELAGTSPSELFAAFEAFGYALYVVDPGKLTRISSADMQPETVIDCLAVKRRPAGLDRWIIVPSMTLEDCVQRVVVESGHFNADCRAWIARTLESAPSPVVAHSDVAAALERLRRDPVAEVREAAAWSDHAEQSLAGGARVGADLL
ncbi:MAG TPA: FkbM family methyltransferase, partial [Actinomycetota bacterium]